MATTAAGVSTRPSRASMARTAAAMERETRMVREAIAMVAMGASSRVVIAGIHYGEPLLDTARRLALESGVRAVPIWRGEHDGADIAIEPIRE